jgi:hypothetical protein
MRRVGRDGHSWSEIEEVSDRRFEPRLSAKSGKDLGRGKELRMGMEQVCDMPEMDGGENGGHLRAPPDSCHFQPFERIPS